MPTRRRDAYYDKNTPDLAATGWKVDYTNMTDNPDHRPELHRLRTAVPND